MPLPHVTDECESVRGGPAEPGADIASASVPLAYSLLPAVHVVVWVTFALLRGHQLSLPDPYDNPYGDWSTTCLLLSLAIWLVGLGWTLWRFARRAHIPLLVVAWLALATLFALWFLLGLLAIVGLP